MTNDLNIGEAMTGNNGERGAALIIALLTLALLLALTMGISLTAISEIGVSNTYGTQTIALQAAEGGLNHAASLVMNYIPPANSTNPGFSDLLLLRPASRPFAETNYLSDSYNPFVTANAAWFTAGAEMIINEDPNGNRGYQLRSAKLDPITCTPLPVPGAY